MSLLDMSLAGGAMVLAVVLARALFLNKLPKMTFVVLWALIAVRLLVPIAIPSPLSIASLLQTVTSTTSTPHTAEPVDVRTLDASATSNVLTTVPTAPGSHRLPALPAPSNVSPTLTAPQAAPLAWDAVLPTIWAMGTVVCASAFAITYLRCRREFQTSLPVHNEEADAWLAEHRPQLRRPLTLRQSDRIATPLTYGVCKPVILVPKTCDWQAREQMRFVLAHEFVHVRRWDAATKLVFVACICVHWFNPLVWVLYVLANRDLELSCDERVVRSFGTASRATYARTLIAMEETKVGLAPLYSGFSKTATEERIVAIMHIKKASLVALAASASLVVGIPAALATSAVSQPAHESPAAAPTTEKPSKTTVGLNRFDTSDWKQVVSATYYDAEDWALVEALAVPEVEDLTIAEFTELARSVATTPEKLDTLMRFMDDPDIRAQASSNNAARFVSHVMAPALANNSAFLERTGTADAHWSNVVWLSSTVVVVDANEETTPLGSALAASGYGDGEICYMLNAHVLDAEALTVGAYVDALESTANTIDDLVDWDLLPTWDRDAGQKLTLAMADIAQNQSTSALTLEATWFFVDSGNGTLTLSDAWNDDADTARALEESLVDYGSATGDDEDTLINALLASYEPFGLSSTMDRTADSYVLSMVYGGSPVRSVTDERYGVWIANSINEYRYGDAGIDLIALYDGGRLVGLRPITDNEQAELDGHRADLSTSSFEQDATGEEPLAATATAGLPQAQAAASHPSSTAYLGELRASYEPFGLLYDASTDTYTYQGKPVRYLFDGSILETDADGTLGAYATANDFYNARGLVDVYVVREVEQNVDGSVNPMGDITGIQEFTSAQRPIVEQLIEGHLALLTGSAQTTATAEDSAASSSPIELSRTPQRDEASVAEGNSAAAGGQTLAERFASYGLTIDGTGALQYNGKAVNAFVDQSSNGVFSYTSPVQSADGLYLRVVYNSAGVATGLKPFDPNAVFTEH